MLSFFHKKYVLQVYSVKITDMFCNIFPVKTA